MRKISNGKHKRVGKTMTTLEDDLNVMAASVNLNNPIQVSRIICEQIQIINGNPSTKLGKSTAENLLNFCKSRAEYGESYPYIKGRAKHYLSMYGAIERTIMAFKSKRRE